MALNRLSAGCADAHQVHDSTASISGQAQFLRVIEADSAKVGGSTARPDTTARCLVTQLGTFGAPANVGPRSPAGSAETAGIGPTDRDLPGRRERRALGGRVRVRGSTCATVKTMVTSIYAARPKQNSLIQAPLIHAEQQRQYRIKMVQLAAGDPHLGVERLDGQCWRLRFNIAPSLSSSATPRRSHC